MEEQHRQHGERADPVERRLIRDRRGTRRRRSCAHHLAAHGAQCTASPRRRRGSLADDGGSCGTTTNCDVPAPSRTRRHRGAVDVDDRRVLGHPHRRRRGEHPGPDRHRDTRPARSGHRVRRLGAARLRPLGARRCPIVSPNRAGGRSSSAPAPGYNTRSGWGGARTWLSAWRAQGWDAPNVLINLGANDSGICDTDIACARRQIQGVIDEIGPGHTIWWPQITRLFTAFAQQDTWNRALQEFADARDDFHTWDWPAELPQYQSADGTHLNPDGYRTRSVRMAELFTRDVAQARRTGDAAPLPTATGEPATFVPIPAQRVADTRTDGSGPMTPGADASDRPGRHRPRRRLGGGPLRRGRAHDIEGVLRRRTVRPAGVGFDRELSPRSPRSARRRSSRSASTTTSACSVPGNADLVVDVQGAFVDRADGLQVPAARPTCSARRHPHDGTHRRTRGAGPGRVQRGGGQPHRHPGRPARVPQCVCLRRQPSDAANLNFRPGAAWAASAIVNVADDDTICVSSNVSTDVIVDITGTFSADDGLRYVPVAPTRMLDTRRRHRRMGPDPRIEPDDRHAGRAGRRPRRSRAPSRWCDRSAAGSSPPTHAPATRRRRRPTPAPVRSWRTRSRSASATPVASVSGPRRPARRCSTPPVGGCRDGTSPPGWRRTGRGGVRLHGAHRRGIRTVRDRRRRSLRATSA